MPGDMRNLPIPSRAVPYRDRGDARDQSGDTEEGAFDTK